MVDFYLVTPNGTPDWDLARKLSEHDEDLSYYVYKLAEAIEDGVLDSDDLTETIELNGQTCWVFQDEHGGLGSTVISNSEWVARDFPDLFAAMAINVAWSTGPKVLAGQADGQTR